MTMTEYEFTPKQILKSGPCTIVFWWDGEKTVVRRSADTPDDDYAAFSAAIAKHIFENNSRIRKVMREATEVQRPKKDAAEAQQEASQETPQVPKRRRKNRMDLIKLGQGIRYARSKAGLTQAQLGGKLGYTGSVISYWEYGYRKPDDQSLQCIANICGVDIAEIINGNHPFPELSSWQKGQLRAIALRQIGSPHAKINDPDAFYRYMSEALTAAAAEYMKCLNKEE